MRSERNIPAPAPTAEDFVPLPEAARRLSVHPDTLRALVREGLPCVDVGVRRTGKRRNRSLRFNVADVTRWLAARREMRS